MTLSIAGLASIGAAGCAAHDTGDAVGEADGELGARPVSAGIAAGSLEEEGVLLLVNDRAVTAAMLESRANLTVGEAESIQDFRTGPDGKPQWFSTLDQIDALPSTTDTLFTHLVADATANGYVEAPGFDDVLKARITVPPNLGRTPTSADVGIEAGFDGKSPAEVGAIVQSRLTNTVDPSNERFVSQTIADNHKAFTLALNNFFVPISPHRIFAAGLAADSLTVIGTMSAVHPTYLVAEKAGVTTYYTRGDNRWYAPVAKPTYPVIMRAHIRILHGALPEPGPGEQPPGVRVFYPAWSAEVLKAPTSVISEGSP